MTARTLHESCEAASAAGRCPSCGAFPREPCVHPGPGEAAGYHLARFAAARGGFTAADLTVVVQALAGRPFHATTVIWDTPG